MAYADAIPLDLLKSEQDRISREYALAEAEVTEIQVSADEVERSYAQAAALLQRVAEIYDLAGDDVRRMLNQAFMALIRVGTYDVEATLDAPWRQVVTAAAWTRQGKDIGTSGAEGEPGDPRRDGPAAREINKEPRPRSSGPGFEYESFGGDEGI